MLNTQAAIKTLPMINTADLPAPDAFFTGGYANNGQNTGGIWSVANMPNIADSGRIVFGACARLPVTTGLPRPAGTMSNVADKGRIGFGACARLPAARA